VPAQKEVAALAVPAIAQPISTQPKLLKSTQAQPTQAQSIANMPLGLYLHVPFCERKCPYCDFNTYAGLQDWFGQTVGALTAELASWAAPLAGRPVTSIFIGGGTPTVLDAAQLTQLFAALHDHLTLAADCEITCEANPGTVDRAKFQHLRGLGVNRLSMGVQSFQPDELEFLGRIHSVEDVDLAFAAARAAGFENINLDFIFGLPHQSITNWAATLDRALALGPEHLSLYSLIVEPNTPLNHWVATGKVDAPDDDLAAEHYELAMTRLQDAGYVHYEVSNWAKASHIEDAGAQGVNPGYASRHNLLYWHNGEYVGIGPGAHSHLRVQAEGAAESDTLVSRRWSNRKPVPGYVKRMVAGQSVVEMEEVLSSRTSMGETMMLGLRLVCEGVPFDRFAALHGVDLRTVFAEEIARLQAQELIVLDEQRVRVTPRGLLVGNQVFAEFLDS
jgi:oxygen-independent coproporphyrinogen-3 oxidase